MFFGCIASYQKREAVQATRAQTLLAALDTRSKPPVEALAPHFTPEVCAELETELLRHFQEGFSKVFQGDLLALERGEAGAGPALRVACRIESTDTVYARSIRSVQYPGLRFRFDLTVDLPSQPEALQFPIAVDSPDNFDIAYTRKAASSATPATEPPTGAAIYRAMASRTLEQVGEAVRKALKAGDSQ